MSDIMLIEGNLDWFQGYSEELDAAIEKAACAIDRARCIHNNSIATPIFDSL